MISVGILLRNFKKFRNLRKEDCLFFQNRKTTRFEALWSLAKFESGVKFQATLSWEEILVAQI